MAGDGIADPGVAAAEADTAWHHTVEDGPRRWEALGRGCEVCVSAEEVGCAAELAESVVVCQAELVCCGSAVSLTGAVESPTTCSGRLLQRMHRPLPPLP